jgi:CheY-like chemotaxis protein/HPt (histidine-containing phosphotransfer) domain-containing protein
MLSFHTINSDEASSGFEAIEMIRKGERYEAIIMDYHMPGMDGLETVRKMRAVLSNSDQPVILLYSSSDDERINSECEELDIRQRLVKPAKINKLFESLSKLSVKYQSVKDIPSPLIKEQISKIQTPQLTILIAEDNVVNMFLTRSIIEGLLPNARIVEADNGLLAVDKYRNEQPNIVFMDIRMPEKNGYEAATAIRQIEKSTKVRIPIVALTAGTAKGEKEKCLEAGMDDYISKPIIQDSIQKALIKWLHIYAEVNLTARNNLNESESHKHFNLGELKNQLGNDTEVVRKLVSTALSNIDECIGKLRQNKLQTESFSETLHMLKGIALSAGFNILAELVLQLEEMHRYSDANKNKKLIEIENEVELIKQLVINSSIL